MEEDAATKRNKFGIVPFAGSDFENWLFRLEVVLEEHDLWSVTFGKAENDKKEKKSRSIIIQCIADSHLEYVKDCVSPKNIISKLKNTFEKKGIASQLLIRRKLLTLKFQESGTLEEHFRIYDTLIRQLKTTGAKPDESELVCGLLLTMPPAYNTVITAIETIQVEISLDFVKKRLLDEELKLKTQEVTENEVFFTRETKERTKYNTGEKGKSFPFECYNCGKKGHMKADCRYRSYYKTKQRFGYTAEDEEEENDKSVFFLSGISSKAMTTYSDIEYIEFIVDSGATDHMVNEDKYLKNIEILEPPISISTARQGEKIIASRKGKVECAHGINLKNVLYAPKLRCNLLSISKIEKAGYSVQFDDNHVTIYDKERKIKEGIRENNLYKIKFIVHAGKEKKENTVQAQKAYSVKEEEYEWHMHLGHASQEKLRILKERKLISFEGEKNKETLCEPCLKGRQTRLPFNKEESQHSKRPLEMIHSDICGPVTPVSHDSKKYILTFIDDYSHFAVVYLLETKTEVLKHFKKYVNMAEAHFGKRISRFRCDNGKEYDNAEFKNFCSERGIKIEFTISYTPQQNGVSERFNRTVVEKARTLLADAKLGQELWGEAIYTSTYIINRLPTRSGIIPAEVWYGELPNYQKLQIFGAVAHVHLMKPQREQGKFQEKSKKYYMIGYCENGYRLWDCQKREVIRARDVIFSSRGDQRCEERRQVHSDCYQDVEDEHSEEEASEKCDVEHPNDEIPENKLNNTDESSGQTERIHEVEKISDKRVRNPPNWLNDYETFHCALTCMGEPENLREALNSPEGGFWGEAVQRELDSHEKHQTWTLVKRPLHKKVIDSKWVFRKKEDTYKARLVAKGYQTNDFTETYSPVGKLTTLRSLLVIANQENLEIEQMDVKTAFLHGELQEEIYMNLPEEKGDMVCKLNRSIYGLKQSPRCWNQAFHEYMCKKGFQCSDYDNCLYISSENGVNIYVFLYVDDILIMCKSEKKISELKSELGKQFEMVSLGPVKKFLGMEIERDYERKVLKIHQKSYVEKVLQKFKMQDCNTVSTPCEMNLKLEKTEDYLCSKPYRELIGCIIYLVVCTRPDLSYTVNYFSRFQNNASDEHYNYLKRVLRYLKLTVDFGLVYKDRGYKNVVLGYCDADWASDIVDRRSVSGYCLMLYNNIVSWCTQKQKTVSLSTAEAEYMALGLICCEAIWFKGFLNQIGINCETVFVCEDNQSCIHIAKNRENSRRVKHIDIKYHFIRNLIEDGLIVLKYVGSSDQLADIFTKALCKPTFNHLRNLIGVEKC